MDQQLVAFDCGTDLGLRGLRLDELLFVLAVSLQSPCTAALLRLWDFKWCVTDSEGDYEHVEEGDR